MAFIKDFLAGLALMLVVIEPASSGELSDGLSAYRRGNYSTAATKLMPIAARGIPEAQTALGFMYEYGRGVPQDAELAAQWYRCAADQGNAGSLYQLGLMHDKGHGVPRSAVIAYELLNLAAARARPAERDYYLRMRDAVAVKLNRAQIAHAQALARAWAPRSGPCR
jgi:uncharacterized protein